MLDDGPGIGPGAEEQLDETMIEEIEKARKGIVMGEQVMVALLGDGERQRPLRPEQAEKFHEHLERLIVAVNDAGEVRRRKFQERVLSELYELIAPRRAVADPRPVLEHAFEMPQHGEVIEPPGFGLKIAQERLGHGLYLSHD